MLVKHLSAIKGELMHYWFETYSSMNTDQLKDGKTKVNYEDFWDEGVNCFEELIAIKSISDLDRFCESWGLNEFDDQFELSFYNLAKKYLKVNYESGQQGTIQRGVQTTA